MKNFSKLSNQELRLKLAFNCQLDKDYANKVSTTKADRSRIPDSLVGRVTSGRAL